MGRWDSNADAPAIIVIIIIIIIYIFVYKVYISIKAKQMSWFWGYAPNRDSKKQPCATKIKNITPVVVYSQCVLKVGGSGQFSS